MAPPFPLKHRPSKAFAWQIDEACGKREEGGEEANDPIMERPGGYRRKKKLGGEREKEQEGLAPSLGLGEGWPVMGMGFGQNKGPSWIGRPFGNKVLALFYFPT